MRVKKNLTDEKRERDSHRSKRVIQQTEGMNDRSNRRDDIRLVPGIFGKGTLSLDQVDSQLTEAIQVEV